MGENMDAEDEDSPYGLNALLGDEYMDIRQVTLLCYK